MSRIRSNLALLALVASLAACGGDGGGDASGGGGDGALTFMTFGAPEELQAYRDVIDAYEASQDDVTVQLIEASDRTDLLARLSTSFSAGDPPDLFLINYRFYAQFAAKGVLEPIESRLAESTAFSEDDFFPTAMDAFRFGGQLTCLPQNLSSLVVYYNKDLFAAAGVDEPTTGWTWDEMVQRAKALTLDLDGDGVVDQYGLGVEPSMIRLAPFVWSNGGEIVDDDEAPTRLTLDTPEAAAALQDFLGLHTIDGVIPGDEEIEAEDNDIRFLNGRTAMVLSSRRSTPEYRSITDFDWDVAPLPVHQEPAGILHSDAYCMASASDDQDAAWDFMEFALGEQGAPIVARSGRTVPSLESVASSEAFLDPAAKPASSRVFLDTIPIIRRVPNVSTWPEIEDAVDAILEVAMYQEGVDATDVALELDAATRDIFARAEGP